MSTFSWKNLKKQADDASRPLPKDWYDLQVSKAEVRQAGTGSLMISARLKVTSGPYANRPLFTNFVLSADNPIALAIFFRNLAAFGLDDAFFETLTGPEDDPSVGLQTVANNLVDRVARGEVGIRTYQGTERNEVLQFARVQGGTTAVSGGAISIGAPSVPGVSGGGTSMAPMIPSTAIPPTTLPTSTAQNAIVEAPPAPPVF